MNRKYKYILLTTIALTFGSALRAETGDQATAAPPIATAIDKSEAIDRENSEVLQRLYPFFVAYGKEEIKMQVSFKTPLVRTVPFYFGYTQLMFYAFDDHEKSFRDVTYNPQLFYRFGTEHWGFLKSIDVGIFDHNSNGKPGDLHRSYNDEYVRVNFETGSSNWLTRFSVKAQALYGLETGNKDIQAYIGPLAFGVTFIQLFEGWLDKSELSLQAVPGGKFANHWEKGGYQLSFSFRLGGVKMVPAFYMQYYNGFAETLLNYNQRVNDFRAGLVF